MSVSRGFALALLGASLASCGGGAGGSSRCAGISCQPIDACHDAGACDPATGACSNPVKRDGAACDDGDACTTGDACQGGHCAGAPRVCLASDACHEAACDGTTGACRETAKADGAWCDDLDGCTVGDACRSGRCAGGDRVACEALDQCHEAGSCDSLTGLCSNPAKPDGSACDDRDACTLAHACRSGACVGSSPVACATPDRCHFPGSCDPATGACAFPPRPAGTVCADGNPCEGRSTCDAAAQCVPGAPPAIDDGDPCTADACDPATGQVTHLPIAGCTPTLPPDPARVAPPLDPTVPRRLADDVAFLHEGASPIQTGVAPGAIDPWRVAVLRGVVLAPDGSPLAGAEITVLAHPELGRTLSRADGKFDLAINGGGLATVQYRKAGFLPAQRQLQAPWRDFAWLPDVVLVPVDAAVTAVALGAGTAQVARGSPAVDADGARQATVIFPAGTQGGMRLPNGTSVPLTSLQLRATEFTVGPRGPQAMPAELPPTTGYTYAVELSADEALAAGATSVELDRAVPLYVENFLGFPVGGIVPTGTYDRALGAWVPSPNGRVVRVLPSTGGLAELDADGDGLADDGAALLALGVTPGERERLAALYAPGASLWRIPVTHFTPFDANWPIACDGCSPPGKPPPQPPPRRDPCSATELRASTVECLGQTLGEEVPIAGTPFSLVYRSDRAAGYAAGRTVTVPLTGPDVPEPLRAVVLRIEVAGTRQELTFPAAPNLAHTFVWDGRDAYGRAVHGTWQAAITLVYRSLGSYATPDASTGRSFGSSGSGAPLQAGARVPVERSQRWLVDLAAPPTFAGDVGGWSLSVRHAVDPASGEILTGDGGRLSPAVPLVSTLAGGGAIDAVEGVAASSIRLGVDLSSVSGGPDGSLYLIAEAWGQTWGPVLRVDRAGIVTTVAGRGSCETGGTGDGGPAAIACVRARSVHAAADGSLYLVEVYQLEGAPAPQCTIRRIGPDGIIATIAGGDCAWPAGAGDDGPAASARFAEPRSVTTSPDGSLYVLDTSAVRRIAPDGVTSTVAGSPGSPTSAVPGPAREAAFVAYGQIAAGPDGSLYFNGAYQPEPFAADVPGILRIAPDGTIAPLVPPPEYGWNIGMGVALGPDGSVYYADGRRRIMRAWPDGSLTVAAGLAATAGSSCIDDQGLDGVAARAPLCPSGGVVTMPDGAVYFGDLVHEGLGPFSARVRRVDPGPLSTAGGFVGSAAGDEVYEFDSGWRHRRTLDVLTGAVRHQHAYDARGLLAAVADGDGNVTAIERDAAGAPTALVAPRGQRTLVQVDASGRLSGVVDPAGGALAFTYLEGGLLETRTDPRGGVSRYAYDALGRLTRDENAAGEVRSLDRSGGDQSFGVAAGTRLGRVTTFAVEAPAAGERETTVTRPDGSQERTRVALDGTRTVTRADGTAEVIVPAPDPRLGLASAFAERRTSTTPSGLSREVTASVLVDERDPARPYGASAVVESETVNGRTTSWSYDPDTRTLTRRTPARRIASMELDAQGRLSVLREPGQLPLKVRYDASGRPISLAQGIRALVVAYDDLGNPSALTDATGATLALTHDAAGRLATLTFPGGGMLQLGRDAGGNLASVAPPGRPVHAFAHDPAERVASYAPPAVPGGGGTAWGRDLDGDLASISLPDGDAVQVERDGAGRIIGIATGRGRTRLAYDAAGRLASAVAPDSTAVSFAYDGFLPTGETWTGPVAGAVTRSYDADFRVSATSVNGEPPVPQAYDADGLLTQAGALAVVRDAASGRALATSLGLVATAEGYDDYGDLASSAATVGGVPLFAYELVRDAAGRVAGKTETVQGVTDTWTYGRDLAGRLTSVARNGAVVATYVYDANGNRLRRTGPGGEVAALHDDQDRLLQRGQDTYRWTAAGLLAGRTSAAGTTAYTYGALGDLLRVALPGGPAVDYAVDGLGRRAGKWRDGVLVEGFLWDGRLRPVAWLDGAGRVRGRFVYGERWNVPAYMVSGSSTYRLLTDHLGSVRLVVDAASGEVVQRIDYDEFGRVLADSAPGFQPFGFGGGLWDRDTGLVRFGARDYDPEAGRWTARDPVLFGGGQANLYAYLGNDPVTAVDPTGLAERSPPQVSRADPNVYGDSRVDDMLRHGKCSASSPGRYEIRFTSPRSALDGIGDGLKWALAWAWSRVPGVDWATTREFGRSWGGNAVVGVRG